MMANKLYGCYVVYTGTLKIVSPYDQLSKNVFKVSGQFLPSRWREVHKNAESAAVNKIITHGHCNDWWYMRL